MTISVSDNTPRVSYSVSEGATQTSFTVSFEFFADADLNVYVDGTKKTLTTHYSVTGGDGSTGSISISVTGASGGSTVVITRGIALERTTDFPVSGAFAISTLNTELDRFVAIQADLDDTITRSIRLADDDAAVSMELPDKDDRLGKVLSFNSSTGAVQVQSYATPNATAGIDGVTAGTVAASKFLQVDANRDLSTIRNVTSDGTITASSFVIGSAAINENDLEALDDVTAGTIAASKAAIVDTNKDITGFRNITLTGELDAGSLDVSGDADIDGTLEADAITIGGVTLAETISDTVGAMVSSNTETNITVSYDDSDNTLDFVIGTLNQNTTGNAATATALATARTIGGTSFDGTGNINVNLAATATALATARTIHGVSFDGTANIDLSEVIQDTVGAMVSSNTESGGIAVTYEDSDGTLDFAISGVTVTVSDSTANTNFPIVFHDESNGLLDDTGALRYNPSTGTLLAPNLVVAGTTTTVNTITMEAANAIIFEGATADDHETTLTITDPTADRTIKLPNQSGTLPVLAADSNTAITSTPEELNILDGVTSTAAEINLIDGDTARGTTALANGDGMLINDGGTMRMTSVETVRTYMTSTAATTGKAIAMAIVFG